MAKQGNQTHRADPGGRPVPVGEGREAWQLPIRKCRCICAQTANIGTEQSPNYPQADWLGDMTTGHTQREKQRTGEREGESDVYTPQLSKWLCRALAK